MKTPPMLLLAVLLFWGWQSGFLIVSAVMGVVLESARFIRVRWQLEDDDFRRLRNFCTLLALALVVYSLASNEEGGGLTGLFHASAVAATRSVGLSATAFLRWLPMMFFLFIAAQMFSERETVPLSAISPFIHSRQKKRGVAESHLNVSYPFFIVCLFSAGIHANEGTHSYFFGQAGLILWALWSLRSKRFGAKAWLVSLLAVAAIAYVGNFGISKMRQLLVGYNAQWIAQFMRNKTDASQSATAMGRIGQLKLSSAIVIRIQTKDNAEPPDYLREASYRVYRSHRQTWFAGEANNGFSDLAHDSGNESAWTLLPGKTNLADVSIACYLNGWSQDLAAPEGLLPLPTGCARLENLPIFSLKQNKTGAVLAGGLGMVIFDAHYASGATIDSPPSATNYDLHVSTNEMPALNQVIAEMNLSETSDQGKLLAVKNFFDNKFTCSAWQGPEHLARTNETELSRFLLRTRSGHCEYFATATVLLLRQLNIPARYAVGYVVHEKSGDGYVVRGRDAHAWCLAWDERAGQWIDFDTTPASWVSTESKHASPFEWLSDLKSWIGFQIAKLRWGQTNLRQYLLWTLIPLLILLLYQLVFRRGRQRLRKIRVGPAAEILWPGLDSEFYQLERKLAARGVPRLPSETLADWLARVLANPGLHDLQMPLQQLLRLHYRHRFDPRGLDQPERLLLTREAKACLDSLARKDRC
jgi:hypothetical protein